MALKYIADGFQSDAEVLLNEFTLKKSTEFKDFAEIWRKRNFSFVYMARENVRELCEFTNEIFSLSSNFLESESFWQKVGSTFLLYALYRNQILNPPVSIRIEYAKFEILKSLLEKAVQYGTLSLYYVLDFLFKNALLLVASTTLLGPRVRFFDKSRLELRKKILLCDFKCNLDELLENNALSSLGESFLKYNKLKATPQNVNANFHCQKFVGIMKKLAEDLTNIDERSYNLNKPSTIPQSSQRSDKETCVYPVIDSDLSQIHEVEKSNDLNELIKSVIKNIVDRVSLVLDKESNNPVTVIKSKFKRPKRPKQVRLRNRRSLQYCEGSPTKDSSFTKVMKEHVDALLHRDSED